MARTDAMTMLVTLLLACGGEPKESASQPIPNWTVADTPDLSIGGEESGADPLYQVGGAIRIATGYVIANRSADEVRFYDETGRLVARNGRTGSGPREFRNPRVVGALAGDSALVHDSSNGRLSIICNGTEICEELPIRHSGEVVGVGRDHVVLQLEVDIPVLLPGQQQGRIGIVVVDRTTLELDTLLILDGQPRQVGGPDNTLSVALPMTLPPQITVSSDAVIVANGRDPVLQVIGFGSHEFEPIELPIELQPIRDADFRTAARNAVGQFVDQIPGLADVVDAMEPPPFRAPIRRLLVDRTGLVWVELDQDDTDRHDWIVVDMAGVIQARVSTPIRVDVLEVGDEYLLGLAQDSLDIEYVKSYRLSRG